MRFNRRGIELCHRGRFAEALTWFDRAVAYAPEFAAALNNRANALRELSRFDEALAYYDKAIAADPLFADAHCNRGVVLRALGRLAEALASYDLAISIRPDLALAFSNRANVLVDLGRLNEALQSCDKALALKADFADARSNRAQVLLALSRPEEALAESTRAITIDPEHVTAYNNQGSALYDLQRPHEALAVYQRAQALAPGRADVLANVAVVLRDLGRIEEATGAIERAIEEEPGTPRFYYILSELRRFEPGDDAVRRMEALMHTAAHLPEQGKIELGFALGRAYADQGHPLPAFQHFVEANALKRRHIAYDESQALAAIDRIPAVFTPELLNRDPAVPRAGPVPIFIVGMPRSGTTLVEQVLASHAAVAALGEVDLFHASVRRHVPDAGMFMEAPEACGALPRRVLQQIGSDYLAAARRLAGHATHITDKLPDNFRLLGLIRLCLPDARIIHVRRDALDTCVSCFSTLFRGSQPFTYDLEELGRYYAAYDRLMAHWRHQIPRAAMLELSYEDLVSRFEREARQLISHCDLEWDDRCLAFSEISRPVHTASAVQVRQPLFQTSVGRSRLYGSLLAPLQSALRTHRPG